MRSLALALSLLAVAAVPSAVQASSISYVKDGDVWLTSPDGSKSYQVTAGQNWRSPSQADDGMLVAQHGTSLVRLTRSGQVIGTPVDVPGGAIASNAPGFRFYGPYDPRVSPDGRTIAYWFTAQDATQTGVGTTYSDWHDFVTTTPSDHFEGGPDVSAYGAQRPSWISNDRTLLTAIYAASSDNVWTWVPGGAADHEQWWFGQPQLGIISDTDLSRDGSRLVGTAATDGLGSAANKIWIWTTNGPASTGAPPYDNLAAGSPRAAKPTLRCQLTDSSEVVNPTWSPDGRQIVYQDASGTRVLTVPDDLSTCDGFSDALLVAGASDPEWGPADVDLAQKPQALSQGTSDAAGSPSRPTGPGAGNRAPVHTQLRALRLGATSFKAAVPGSRRGGTTLRFVSSAATPVALVVQRCTTNTRCGKVVGRRTLRAVAGSNTVRFNGRLGKRRLTPGRYSLTLRAGDTSLRAAFRIV